MCDLIAEGMKFDFLNIKEMIDFIKFKRSLSEPGPDDIMLSVLQIEKERTNSFIVGL
jgi:uncharacterized protein (DUF2344 family)